MDGSSCNIDTKVTQATKQEFDDWLNRNPQAQRETQSSYDASEPMTSIELLVVKAESDGHNYAGYIVSQYDDKDKTAEIVFLYVIPEER